MTFLETMLIYLPAVPATASVHPRPTGDEKPETVVAPWWIGWF